MVARMKLLRTAITLAAVTGLAGASLAGPKANWLTNILGKPRTKVEATLGKPVKVTPDGVLYNYGDLKGIMVTFHNNKGNPMAGIEIPMGTETDYRTALKKVGLNPKGVTTRKSTSTTGVVYVFLDNLKGLPNPEYWSGYFVMKPGAPSRLTIDDGTK
jgi:hypothetical protein